MIKNSGLALNKIPLYKQKDMKDKNKRLGTVSRAIFSFTELFSQSDIENILKNENFKRNANKILPSTWRMISNKENRQMVIDTALKGLEENNPENATYEKAVLMADAMQALAARVVKEIDTPHAKN